MKQEGYKPSPLPRHLIKEERSTQRVTDLPTKKEYDALPWYDKMYVMGKMLFKLLFYLIVLFIIYKIFVSVFF